MRRAVAVVVLSLAIPIAGAARTITFPLVVDYPLLEAELKHDLDMPEGTSLELWGTPGDCHWAVVDDVRLAGARGKLEVVAPGSAAVGFRLLWLCVSPLAWQGTMTLATRPVVGTDWQLRFEPLAVAARDPDGKSSPLANGALQLIKGRLEERLRAVQFDLAVPADEAKALIAASATREEAKPALAALATLRPLDTVADDDGVRIRVAMDVPDGEPAPRTPEPALTEAEAAAWQERLDRWDAFLVFVVKALGATTLDRGVRTELLAILLDARRDLVDVLRQGPVPGTDPVRSLFLSAWDRLRVETRRALKEGRLGASASRFVTFLAAGDALATLDQAGPGLGLEISADGLRRLARVLEPDRKDDPVAVSETPDPELQRLFGFEEPAASEQTPPTVPATSTTTTLPPTAAEPVARLLEWLWSPRLAAAATVDLGTIGQRLDRWVPTVEELSTYRAVVADLLTMVTAHRTSRVESRLGPVYRHLVPTVAWQESCWRQFVQRDGKVTFLESGTGDVGIMQVNRRVWRGFFDVRRLEWDPVYNAAAGAEILVQLLARFGASEGASVLDNAARASYSAYNAGPSQHRRYRSPKASPLGRAIDGAFYEKYRLMSANQAGDRVLCM